MIKIDLNVTVYKWHTLYIGNACRNKVLNKLRKKFVLPETAEVYYFPSSTQFVTESDVARKEQTDIVQAEKTPSQHEHSCTSSKLLEAQIALSEYCATKEVTISCEFVQQLVAAMEHLKQSGRANVFTLLAKGIGTMRTNGSDSKFPVKRMPFGMVEYISKFFASDTLQQVSNSFIHVYVASD